MTIFADGFELEETNYTMFCGNRLIEIQAGNSYTPYIIFGFNNNKLILCEYNYTGGYLGPKFEIPYSFNNLTKELTLELEGQEYVLGYKANTENTMIFTISK